MAGDTEIEASFDIEDSVTEFGSGILAFLSHPPGVEIGQLLDEFGVFPEEVASAGTLSIPGGLLPGHRATLPGRLHVLGGGLQREDSQEEGQSCGLQGCCGDGWSHMESGIPRNVA